MNRTTFGSHRNAFCLVLLTALGMPSAIAQNSSASTVSSARQGMGKTRFSDRAASSNAPSSSAQTLTAACGTGNPNYKVKLNKTPPTTTSPVPTDKALVYFIHDGWDGTLLAYPTTVFGLDGQWIGADHGNSYFSVAVDPGEHHVCSTLQTSIMDSRVELAHFTAVAGQTYYFRTRLILSRSVELLEMEPFDSDQGRMLAFVYPLAVSRPKK